MTTLSRRTAVLGAAAFAGLGALGVTAVPALARSAVARPERPHLPVEESGTTTSPESLADSGDGLRAAFTASIGATFRAVHDGLTRTLTLVAVDDVVGAVDARDAFRLTFDGVLAADGIHTISAANVRPLELYLGNVGSAADRGAEAIIDRRQL
ncbi:hypothetical protein GCM10028798_11060 [Humibacter antri]